MTDWLDDEIQAANERAQQRERKLARRDSDTKTVEAERGKFWSSLITSLAASIDRFNNRRGGPHEGVSIADRNDGIQIWINTPGYPTAQLYVEFREGMNDILISMTERKTTRSTGDKVLSGTLEFDVNDSGQIVVRDDGT